MFREETLKSSEAVVYICLHSNFNQSLLRSLPEKQIFKTTCERLEYSDRKLGDQITTPYHVTYNRPISFGILKLLFLGTPDCCARYYFLRNLFVGPSLREKCPNTEFFLVHIFPHLDWIRRDTPYLSVFSLNAGKYGPEKTPYLNTSRSVYIFRNFS